MVAKKEVKKAVVKTASKTVKKPKKENVELKLSIPSFNDEMPSYGIRGDEGMLESNEVYDEADIASKMEAGFIAQALQNHKAKVAPESHPDFDGVHCIDCDVEIPKERLAMRRIRCVHCQTELEEINRRRGIR